MVKCSAKTDDGWILVFGLSDGNLERLRESKPIQLDMGEMTRGELKGKVTIFWGRNEQAMADELQNAGLIGPETVIHPLPPDHP